MSRGGGNPDLHAPVDSYSIARHIFEDLLPYVYCCAPAVTDCSRYTQFRPPRNNDGYAPRIPGQFSITL